MSNVDAVMILITVGGILAATGFVAYESGKTAGVQNQDARTRTAIAAASDDFFGDPENDGAALDAVARFLVLLAESGAEQEDEDLGDDPYQSTL